MTKILCLDTATDICSVALFENDKLISSRESGDDRSHAIKLAVYIDEVLREAKTSANELSAVAVSMGPGSYTGLRIGVSTAKGICYGAGIPLLSVSTLQAMCYGVSAEFLTSNKLADFYFCPLLDARRMEVYTSVFDGKFQPAKDISAEIIDENSFNEFLSVKPTIFFGSGAEKIKPVIQHPNALFFDNYIHSAKNMLIPATEKLRQQQFEDVAYFEPFYLKDFIATVPRNKVI
jgi:tRNA threonylcarbamoyladenosine biosynthesis protein TsaB